MNGLGEVGLLGGQVAFGVLGQLVGQDEQASSAACAIRATCWPRTDLYFGCKASCFALSSSSWRACSTSRFLRSTSWFCCASRLGFFLQFLVGVLEFLLAGLQLLRERLRLGQQVFRSHVGFDGVQHDTDGSQ